MTAADATTADHWFGSLPRGWDSAPLRFMVRFESGSTPDKSKRSYWDGTIPWVSPKDMKVDAIADSEDHVSERALQETSLSTVPVGSVLLVVRGMILAHSVPVALTTAPVTINQDMKALRCSERLEPRFLKAVVQGAKGWFLANTGESSHGTKKLETDVIGRFVVPLPSVGHQRAIADYLDAETARIDALIAAKENLLAILAEKRRAIISHAVTRGLDPTAETCDSGIRWLGEIPAHWELMRLKFLLRGMEQGWSPECHNSPAGPQDWGVLKAGCCNGGIFRPEENKMLPADLTPPPALEVNAGDVLMSRASGSPALIGSAARVPRDVRRQLLLSDKMYRLRPNTERVDPDFLVWILGSFVGRHQVVGAISGAAGLANNISQSSVREFVFPTPPLEEQRQLVLHLRASNSAIGRLEEVTERSLLLLRERRDAVIAAAVTGRLDVEAA